MSPSGAAFRSRRFIRGASASGRFNQTIVKYLKELEVKNERLKKLVGERDHEFGVVRRLMQKIVTVPTRLR